MIFLLQHICVYMHTLLLFSRQVVPDSLWSYGLYVVSFSVYGIFQARILEWVAIFFSRGSSQPRDQTHVFCVSCIAGRFFTTEPPQKPHIYMYVDIIIWAYTHPYTYICTHIHTVSVFHFCCNKSPQSSVQSLCRVRLFATPWIAARQASLSITNSWSSPRLMFIELVMPSSRLILCRPLLLLPSIPPSIRVFSNESTSLEVRLHLWCMRWPKYWSFSFSIIPSKEHPGLISFRMDWLDLLTVQGTLKSLLRTGPKQVQNATG